MKFHDIIYFYVNKSPSSIIFDWIYIRDNFSRQRFPKLSKLVVFIFFKLEYSVPKNSMETKFENASRRLICTS